MSDERITRISNTIENDGLGRLISVDQGRKTEVLCRCDGTFRAVQECMNAVAQFQTPTLKGCGLETMQNALHNQIVQIDEPGRAHDRLRALTETKQLCALGGMARLIERMP